MILVTFEGKNGESYKPKETFLEDSESSYVVTQL